MIRKTETETYVLKNEKYQRIKQRIKAERKYERKIITKQQKIKKREIKYNKQRENKRKL